MKVLNKTDKELKIRVTDRYGNMYSIYLPGGRSTELDPTQVSRDVLEFIKMGYLKDVSVETKCSHVAKPIVIESHDPVECACSLDSNDTSVADNGVVPEDVQEPSAANEDSAITDPEESSEPSVYVCELCGSEFASLRGLNMHKNKSHPNESNKEV